MIKAIIFDCFGVLTSDGWLPFKQKYFGSDPEKFEEASRLNALANGYKIPYSQFLSEVSALANVSSNELDRAMHHSVRNDQMLEFIADLKKSYKIGMLSNISGDWLAELFTPEQVTLFDALALSFETGFAKPDPRAYESIMERLDFRPQECVYIDDQQTFVQAANALGMQTIHFKDFECFKNQLVAILEMTNTNK